jgi:hypothetical protein
MRPSNSGGTGRSKAKEFAAMLKAIHGQEDRAAARTKADQVIEKLVAMKLGAAAEIVRRGVDETLSYIRPNCCSTALSLFASSFKSSRWRSITHRDDAGNTAVSRSQLCHATVHAPTSAGGFCRCCRNNAHIAFWEEPIKGETYGIGVDTAEGLAHGDNSVISVVRKSTGEEVAQMAGKISPH